MRSLRMVLCGFTAALACTSSASAGTITLPNGPTDQFRDMFAVYRAAPGETNRLNLVGCYSRCFGEIQFTDESAPLTGDSALWSLPVRAVARTSTVSASAYSKSCAAM